MIPTIADAARAYRHQAGLLRLGVRMHGRAPWLYTPLAQCDGCAERSRLVEAASVAYDAAVAWTYAGSRPRGHLLREIPA